MFQLQNWGLTKIQFSWWHCHLHPLICGFLFVKIDFHNTLVSYFEFLAKCHTMAANIFSGSQAIFADLEFKKVGLKIPEKLLNISWLNWEVPLLCKEVKVNSIWSLQLAAWTLFTGNCNAEQSATALVGAEGSPESAVSHMQHCSWVWSRCWLWANLGTSVPMDSLSIL